MPKPQEIEVCSLEEYAALLDSLGDHVRWYRGCGKATYQLIPSLYRHSVKQSLPDRLQLEGEILTWFKQRSLPYLQRDLREDWEFLLFMQHFRIPTRLLDWTESPFVALYFALRNERHAKSNRAAVWVLRPDLWNQHALAKIGFEGGAIPAGDRVLDAHAPGTTPSQIRPKPVAILGTHNSPRIVAQKGTFVVFGADMGPMEGIYAGKDNDEDKGFPADTLTKITVPRKRRGQLLRSLIRAGVTDSVVFPDLEGLAMEAKRQFGFEVE